MNGPSRPCLDVQATVVLPRAPSSRNLVVVRAGRQSLHPRWTRGDGNADFDLFVVPYEQGTPDDCGATERYYFAGRKFEGYNALFSCRQDLLDTYEYIAFFDDDLDMAKADINSLFAVGRRYRLDLFQPSLSWDSHFSYAATLTSATYKLRYTNMVEMMCPVFRTSYLKQVLPLFGLGYELGIDLIWSRISDDPWFRIAIVDEVVVRHTRPVGTSQIQHTFGPEGQYDDQIAVVLGRFATTFRGTVAYSAINRKGKAVLSRYRIACASLWLWWAWRRSPMHFSDFARFVTDYTRHCLTRPINLDRIDIGGRFTTAAPVGAPEPPGHSP
jgi:hypothetical protein